MSKKEKEKDGPCTRFWWFWVFLLLIIYISLARSDEASLTAAFEKAVQALRKIDGIVTAAGIAIDKPFVEQSWAEVEKVIQVNVRISFPPSLLLLLPLPYTTNQTPPPSLNTNPRSD
jgi:NAD(P)-dependent dehydrogenase (short-subunit alcohol dehydrogenase family)